MLFQEAPMSDGSFSRARIAIGLVLLVGAATPGRAAPPEVAELRGRLEPSVRAFKASQALLVKFTLSNDTDKEMTLLRWHTPLEAVVNADMFEVTAAGTPAEYIGRTIKRGTPKPADYVTIAARSTVSAEVDLSKAYAVYQRGRYSARLRPSLIHLGPAPDARRPGVEEKARLEPRLLRSDEVTFDLEEERPRPPILMKRDLAPKATEFKDCSTDRQAQLARALQDAKAFAILGRDVLKTSCATENPAEATRYTTWFGAVDRGRYALVTDHFTSIAAALAGQPVTFNCACAEDFFAFVYPLQPYEIFVCNLFWPAPATGTDSQLGTLVHEMSHFKVVAGTLDTAYGKPGCQGLALRDPDAATRTADCHEYFAENDPALRMPSCGVNPSGPPPVKPNGTTCGQPAGGMSLLCVLLVLARIRRSPGSHPPRGHGAA
jgi:peptidyl-Lys metalloendopeptidase